MGKIDNPSQGAVSDACQNNNKKIYVMAIVFIKNFLSSFFVSIFSPNVATWLTFPGPEMKSIKASPQEYDELGFNPKDMLKAEHFEIVGTCLEAFKYDM